MTMTHLVQNFRVAYLVLALFLFIMPMTARAQFSQNNSAPLDGSADQISYKKDKIVLSGQVEIRKGSDRILADTVHAYSAEGNSSIDQTFQNVSKIEAIGNFYYITPEQEVRGDRGLFSQSDNSFTVTGNVILLQGKENVVTGDRLIYNLTTEEARIVGSCKGRKCGRKGRVRILIKNSGNNAPSVNPDI